MTKPVSLEDALKKEPPKFRSLDEILASASQIKTAAATQATVTAAVKEEPKAEVKEAKKEEPKAEAKVEIKKAEFNDSDKKDSDKKDSDKKDSDKKDPKTAEKKNTLKMASSLDFRNWEAQEVVDAWKQHSTVEACVKNVGSDTSNPKLYCSLLQVAASEAGKIIKAAEAKKVEKTAAQEKKVTGPVWKKIAKLTPEEKQFVSDFFSKLYGKDYVEALVTDY